MQQEFLRTRLDGDRFGEHSVPLELLKDFAALQEMLVEVAKWQFRQSHPDRQRIPRNFSEGVDLHLTSVEDGSAILTISLVFAGLFPASNNLEYFDQAKTSIINTIAAADQNHAPDLPGYLLNYFDRFGRGLRPGESISFDRGTGRAVLTPETRGQLLRYAQVTEWTEEASLRVRIPEADKGRKTFEVELVDGTKLKAELMDVYAETVLDAFLKYGSGADEFVLLQCSAMRDRNGYKTLTSIEHATPLDALDVPLRLEQIGLLRDGWLDGKGVAPQKDGLRWMAKVFDTNFDADLPLPHIYPTPEGGVQAEWNLGDWSVSLEIDLATKVGSYLALNLRNHDECSEVDFDLSETEGWSQLNTAVKKLTGQDQEVRA